MEVWYAIVQFFENGGAFMYPIVLLLALGLGVSIERYVTLTLARKRNRQT
jgi:biopolymer transport protein ExbB